MIILQIIWVAKLDNVIAEDMFDIYRLSQQSKYYLVNKDMAFHSKRSLVHILTGACEDDTSHAPLTPMFSNDNSSAQAQNNFLQR